VVLKAQDEPTLAEAIDALSESGVPVVTYTTDVPNSGRCAYVGIDNRAARRDRRLPRSAVARPDAVGRTGHLESQRVPW
jgi:hypothetical protein